MRNSILRGTSFTYGIYYLSITYAAFQSFLEVDTFSPHAVMVMICLYPAAGTPSLVGHQPLPRAEFPEGKITDKWCRTKVHLPKACHRLVKKEVSELRDHLLVKPAHWKSCQSPSWNHSWNCWLPASCRHMRGMCDTAANLLRLLNSPNVLAKIHL